MSFSIKIKDFEYVGEHIEFTIEVTDKITGECWKFSRRYSVLREVHKQFKALDSKVPEFPPKKLFGSKNPKFLEQRRNDLEGYFSQIVKIPKLLENPFTKEFLKPKDIVMDKNTVAQVVTPYKRPKQGPEMQNFVNQLNDVVSAKFFDLSAQPIPPEDEELKQAAKFFENLLKNHKISEIERLPEGSHANDAYKNTEVVKQRWVKKSLKKLVRIAKQPIDAELLIKFQ